MLNDHTGFVGADDHKAKGSGLAPWPARLTSPPPRLQDFGYSNEMFEKDTVIFMTRMNLANSNLDAEVSNLMLPCCRKFGGVELKVTGIF